MAYELLEKELAGLPDDALMKIVEYVRFLKFTAQKSSDVFSDSSAKKNKRKIGVLADDFVSIADDFDETLEGLEDYI